MRILVTGGAGFIGSHIVDRLVLEGHEVAVVDDLSTGKRSRCHSAAAFTKVDLLSRRLVRVFRDFRPEVVSHHAAQTDVRRSVKDPVADARTNILGFLHVLELALRYGTRRVLFASSGGAIYGEQEIFPAPESHPLQPVSPYGASKLAGEAYLGYYASACGLKTACLRYANVYGPRQDASSEAGVVAIFTKQLLAGETPTLNGTGLQTRDFIYVGDVVEAHQAALHGDLHEPVNIGTGTEVSVLQLFRHLCQLTGVQAQEVHGQARRGEQLRSCLDASKMHQLLGWTPAVSLLDGLRMTVEAFRQEASGH